MRIRVLWLCNCPIEEGDHGHTGTWLGAMARGLVSSGEIDLGIVALGGGTNIVRQDVLGCRQWIVPHTHAGSDGLPPRRLVQDILEVCHEFRPDLINVWGTECFWGLLISRGLLGAPSILTMQGIKYRIAECYGGGMNRRERLAALGPREVVKAAIGRDDRTQFEQWGRLEREIMAAHCWAVCQTPWQEAHMRSQRPDAVMYPLDLPLREDFRTAAGWCAPFGAARIFCNASYGQPYKGLHVAVRALHLVKRRFPDVQLRIAGAKPAGGILQDGYMRWIVGEVRRLGLVGNISWLGRLSADAIALELGTASAAVMPSFIESYSLTFAEALSVGTPTVASFTGGTAYLGRDESTCLFFPPGDEGMCAYQLVRILEDRELALRLSAEARRTAASRHDPRVIVLKQIAIYREVAKNSGAPVA